MTLPVQKSITPFERMMIPRSPACKIIKDDETDFEMYLENKRKMDELRRISELNEYFITEFRKRLFKNVHDYPGHYK